MLGYKTNETRSWDTKHDGPLAIHASVGKPAWARQLCENDPHIRQILAVHGLTFDTLPRGAILGTCMLLGTLPIAGPDTYLKNEQPHMFCHPEWLYPVERATGDYTPGRFAWLLRKVVPCSPQPCKGALSLWQVPADIAATLAELAAAATPPLWLPDTSAEVRRNGVKIGTITCLNIAPSSQPPAIRWYGANAAGTATGQAHRIQADAEADVVAWSKGEQVAYPKCCELEPTSDTTVLIRTYEFDKGFLHLERKAADGLSAEEIEEMYGKVLSTQDGEMPASEFFDLPDFRDI